MTGWKIHHLKMYFLLKMWIFQCHVSFAGCNPWKKAEDQKGKGSSQVKTTTFQGQAVGFREDMFLVLSCSIISFDQCVLVLRICQFLRGQLFNGIISQQVVEGQVYQNSVCRCLHNICNIYIYITVYERSLQQHKTKPMWEIILYFSGTVPTCIRSLHIGVDQLI